MTFVGRFADTFAGANSALAIGVHMNGDYEFHFEVLGVGPSHVKVKSLKNGKVTRRRIRRDGDRECFVYLHRGMFQSIFGGPAERVTVVPFNREAP